MDMRLELGAMVRSAGGEDVGTVDQLVVDTHTEAITQFIVRTGRFHSRDILVPVDAIAREDDDNTLHLIFSTAQVRALPAFEEERFVVADHTDRTAWRYLAPVGMSGGYSPSIRRGAAHEGGRAYDPGGGSLFGVQDVSDEIVETRSNLSEWDYREGKGTKVVTRDDHTIGVLHEVDIDEEGKPVAIIVATGLIHHGHRTISIARVRWADSQQIMLDVTKDQFDKAAD